MWENNIDMRKITINIVFSQNSGKLRACIHAVVTGRFFPTPNAWYEAMAYNMCGDNLLYTDTQSLVQQHLAMNTVYCLYTYKQYKCMYIAYTDSMTSESTHACYPDYFAR